jgi:hypothetical protein
MALDFYSTKDYLRIPICMFRSEPAIFMQFETGGYRNLRTTDGRINPLFRIEKKTDRPLEKIGVHPFEDREPFQTRRKTRSNHPLLDLFMELDRLMHFPKIPSRNLSYMGNSGGFQEQYWNADQRLCLIIPHESSLVAISGTEDFRLSTPKEAVEFILEGLKWKGRAEKLRFKEAFDTLFSSEHPAGKELTDLAFSMRDIIVEIISFVGATRQIYRNSGTKHTLPQSYIELLEYWDKCTLIENKDTIGHSFPSEVLIQGKCRVVEIQDFSIHYETAKEENTEGEG